MFILESVENLLVLHNTQGKGHIDIANPVKVMEIYQSCIGNYDIKCITVEIDVAGLHEKKLAHCILTCGHWDFWLNGVCKGSLNKLIVLIKKQAADLYYNWECGQLTTWMYNDSDIDIVQSNMKQKIKNYCDYEGIAYPVTCL